MHFYTQKIMKKQVCIPNVGNPVLTKLNLKKQISFIEFPITLRH